MSFSLLKARSKYIQAVCLPLTANPNPGYLLWLWVYVLGESQKGHGARGCMELVLGKAGHNGTSTSRGKSTSGYGTWLAWGRRKGKNKFCCWGDFVQGCLMQNAYIQVRRAVGGVWQCVVEVVSLGLLRRLRGLQYSSA